MAQLRKDLEIKPIKVGLCTLNYLRIEVHYTNGGYSWFNGEYAESGIRVSITPIGMSERTTRTIIDGKIEHQGFNVPIIKCERLSVKKMELAAQKVFPYAEEIRDLFEKGEYYEIVKLIQNIQY